MASVLKNEFGERCYMSCGLLKTKSTILHQFQGNVGKYSFEIILRYTLIILIGFYQSHFYLETQSQITKN